MTEKSAEIQIVIDGKKVVCQPGETVIQAADRMGIYIPRFCYHDKLSVVANCRMCLVDVHKAPKALPACATPVADGMEVSTRSKRAVSAQRAVMEFLLINHPLDCPICDQGGECELQDAAMGFGRGVSRFEQTKRAVADEDLGPLVATEMTRCIHCTRCVRFGEEIAGMPELGALGRGESTKISTYLQSGVQSELSGNMIDVCPVGALTAKPSQFKGRSWSFQQHAMIAQHDGIGSHQYMHTIVNNTHEVPRIMRVVPHAFEPVNEVWLSNVDRFSYEGLSHKGRLQHPLVKRQGRWHQVSWVEALDEAVSRFQGALSRHGREQAAGLISPNASVETLYLFQKWLRSLGVTNIDHRLRRTDSSEDPSVILPATLGLTLEAVESQQVIVLFGDDVRRTQPLLNHRIRQAQLKGAKVFVIGANDSSYNFEADGLFIRPETWDGLLYSLATGERVTGLGKEAEGFVERVRSAVGESEHNWVLLGQDVAHHPKADALTSLATFWEQNQSLTLGHLSMGANSVGAVQMGVLPGQGPFGAKLEHVGMSLMQALESPRKAYWLHHVEPSFDLAMGQKGEAALAKADCVVAVSMYDNPTLRKHADVILPVVPYSEETGTVVNMEGRWQRSQAAIPTLGEARPAWKVYRVLGNLTHAEGFDYQDLADVQTQIDALRESSRWPESGALPGKDVKKPSVKKSGVCLFSQWPLERSDAIVRRATSLQAAADFKAVLRVHPKTLAKHGWVDGQSYLVSYEGLAKPFKQTLVADATVAEDVLYRLSALAKDPCVDGTVLNVMLEACK